MLTIGNIIPLIFVVLGLVSLFRPFWLLCLFATLPALPLALSASSYDTEIKMMQVGSINVYAGDYLILMLLVVLLSFLLKGLIFKIHPIGQFISGPVSKAVIAFFLWNVFIGILSYTKGFHLQNVLRRISSESVIFIVLLVPLIKDFELKKNNLIKYICLLSTLIVGFSLWRYNVTHEVAITSSDTLRAVSGNAVIVFMIPICYVLFYYINRPCNKTFSYLVVALSATGIILAGHRSGFLALLFIIAMWYFYSGRFRLSQLFIPLWSVSLLIIAILVFPVLDVSSDESFFRGAVVRLNDTFDAKNHTTQERLEIWKYSIEVIKESPFLGYGTFPAPTQSEGEGSDLISGSISELKIPAHNLFVDKFIHEGLLGLGVLCVFLFVLLKQAKAIGAFDKNYANFLYVYMLSFLFFSMFNTTFSGYEGKIYFSLILGLLNAEVIKSRRIVKNKIIL